MRSLPLTLTLPLLLLFLAAGCGGADSDGTGGDAAPGAQPAPAEEPEMVDLADIGYDEGDLDGAAVRVIEFSDFGCIFCARFHVEDYHVLRAEFVAPGDVAWKYVVITVGGFPNGELAALTGECVGEQGRFPAIRDLLFEERDAWLGASESAAPGVFRGFAQSVGADMAAFDACMEGEEVRARVDLQNRVAAQVGVQGTPTFIVEGFPVQGAPPLESFRAGLRDMVNEVRSAQSEAGSGGPGG
jgi:protein-disulfide isomerase